MATRALQIKGAVPCSITDLAVSDDLDETRYGWILGDFKSDNNLWGLPVRGDQNFYMTGVLSGLFSTFDIAAGKAEISEC